MSPEHCLGLTRPCSAPATQTQYAWLPTGEAVPLPYCDTHAAAREASGQEEQEIIVRLCALGTPQED